MTPALTTPQAGIGAADEPKGIPMNPPEVAEAVKRVTASCAGWTVETAAKASAIHLVKTADVLTLLTALSEANAIIAGAKPGAGDLWWNPSNEEVGFLHFADAFEDANEDGEDYSVELHRARKLPPVWGALIWVDGEQKIKVFSTEAEADAARLNTRTAT